MKEIHKLLSAIFDFLSGESILKAFGNGGFTIFVRSVIVSVQLFAIALVVKSWCEAGVGSVFSLKIARSLVGSELEWLGALFAGCYVALYSRYSSQWSYLAGLYNQIMSVKCGIDETNQLSNKTLIRWQVGFIADAHTLHLDSKELFAGVIKSLLAQKVIFEEFEATLGETSKVIIKRVNFVPANPLLAEAIATPGGDS